MNAPPWNQRPIEGEKSIFLKLFEIVRLSPASRFILLGLQRMAIVNHREYVEGDVKKISRFLSVSDKTFKKAIDELRENRFVRRRKYKTKLGANSFRYYPFVNSQTPSTPPIHIRISSDNIQPPFIQQKTRKMTVSQRLLRVVALSFSGESGFVTSNHVKRLSKLTGIKEKNIYINLKKLAEMGCFKQLTPAFNPKYGKTENWIFIGSPDRLIKGDKVIIFRDEMSESKRISMIIDRKKISSEIASLWAKKDHTSLQKYMSIDAILRNPFPGIEQSDKDDLIELFRRHKKIWIEAKLGIGEFYLDAIAYLVSLQLLSNSNSENSDDFASSQSQAKTCNQLECLISDFPIPSETIVAISKVIFRLSVLIAKALKNTLQEIIPTHDIKSCHVHVFKPDSVLLTVSKIEKAHSNTSHIFALSECYGRLSLHTGTDMEKG